jgi:hypothetical protein
MKQLRQQRAKRVDRRFTPHQHAATSKTDPAVARIGKEFTRRPSPCGVR